MMALRFVLVAILATAAACGDAPPTCSEGELRFTGRPPPRLFSYETTCREDCFSPFADECGADCGEVAVEQPAGALLDGDHTLWLVDAASLNAGRGADSDLALLFSFGFVDETGGTAPAGWSFLQAGAASYSADTVRGLARFFMTTAVVHLEQSGAAPVAGEYVGEAIAVAPGGRLEILGADPSRLWGRFFLTYETPSRQPQGEVLGCFDLAVGAAEGGVRSLSP